MPRTECLKDVVAADACPTGRTSIQADLRAGQTVLVAAHGNSLRALVKHLDGISDDDIAGLNIPTGMPLVYRLDDDFMPTRPAGVPRPRGRRGGRRRGRQPGPLTAARRVRHRTRGHRSRGSRRRSSVSHPPSRWPRRSQMTSR